MRYRNGSHREIEFTLRGRVHKVAPGHTCEIPVELEYALASRGLPLERDLAEPEPEEEPLEVPSAWRGAALPPPGSNAHVWLTRALEASAEAKRERERAEDAEERAGAAERHIDELRADLEKAARERDEALALVEAAGAAKAEEERQRERANVAERQAAELRTELAAARRERIESPAGAGHGGFGKPEEARTTEGHADSGEHAGDETKPPHASETDAGGGSQRRHRK